MNWSEYTIAEWAGFTINEWDTFLNDPASNPMTASSDSGLAMGMGMGFD